MFSGIIETVSPIQQVILQKQAVEVQLTRPHSFDDIKVGDSIACNGVCLTVHRFTDQSINFILGFETLKTLEIQPESLNGQVWNLERSLRFGDRVHGHLVTGHIEALGRVVRNEAFGDSWFLSVECPKHLLKFIWKKGSLSVHGVSLTVNEIQNGVVEFCLIPETVSRTNLSQIPLGGSINIETDYLAKLYLRNQEYEPSV
jgi:riboflavin synthase